MAKKFNYRLGFDLGYTSLGWACVLLDEDNLPCAVHDFGVRIFPSGRDDKSKAPTSVERREKRGARRNRDRYLKRRQALLEYMVVLGLQPKEASKRQQLAQREPLILRAKGVSEALTLHELGRALFHLNQRRGFKSNRIAERGGNEDESGLKKGIHKLEKTLRDNQITLGQYLWGRLEKGQSTRLKADEAVDQRWTSRQMYIDEFKALMLEQKKYHPNVLNEKVVNQLFDIIFFQRSLKPQTPGLCTLMDGENRARLAYPITQQFRIYQEVNHLEIIKETAKTPSITPAMRKKLLIALTETFIDVKKDGIISWSKIEKIIGVKGVKFNLDHLGRSGLQVDKTTRIFMQTIPDWWQSISELQQRQIIDAMQSAQTDHDLKERLTRLEVDITTDVVEKLQTLQLVDGYGRLSVAAMEKIMPYLQQGMIYSEACRAAGFNHSDDYEGCLYPEGNLPFYGEVLPKQVIGGSYAPKDRDNPENYSDVNNFSPH